MAGARFASEGAAPARRREAAARDGGGIAVIDEAQREGLNALAVSYPDLEDEAKHFYVCEACGQAVDMRRLGGVLHHEEPGHDPLPLQ